MKAGAPPSSVTRLLLPLAQLPPGDVIVSIDGQPVTDADQLVVVTLTRKPAK